MPDVVIYSKGWRGYCICARALLARKGATLREIEIEGDDAPRDEMVARAGGRRTVPQVFSGATHAGGCDGLYRLEEGRLDAMLA
jgi:glutaredoxin 3